MAEFNMQIAGVTARVHSLFESTPQYFHAYLTDDAAVFSITVTKEDLVFEQEDALEEAKVEGFRPRIFPDTFLERAAIQRGFAEFLLGFDTLLFHGSVIAVDGKGYLFTAKSGTGKSTHTRLWRELLGTRAVMVNDDKPFLRITDEGTWVYGSPWSGKHGLDSNICVPLKGICLLERGAENTIRPAQKSELLPMLKKQGYHPLDTAQYPHCLSLVEHLAERVPLWYLQCNKDLSAAKCSFEAMAYQNTI